ncbi:hypothetical protein EVAR_27241_1 [Eumeta japonica]|uniref:RNase H type-1 domain-containing protein n=1 Tax=Eumeta variegata TaxID=151549 RepID=A0A4C1VYC9_EUMVA|nr:hypothetical protein EVAR_27241_1 [Eumeta japonica]
MGERRGIISLTFSLDPFCTVFQSELYALHRAILLIKSKTEPKFSVFNDSKASLELLMYSKAKHLLAKSVRENISKIRAENREVQLFWLKAQTAGNERADELAKIAALRSDMPPDNDKVPLS